MRLDPLDEAQGLEIGDDARARHAAVEPAIGGGDVVIERGFRRHDIDERQAVPLPDLVVVEIVRRSDLHAAAAERRVDIGIADDGDVALRERQANAAADQVPVALIIRMHRDRRISQHGFRPRGGDDEIAAAVAERISQVPKAARLLDGNDFQVGQSRLEHRIPIDEPLAPVDQPFAEEANERFGHRLPTARDPW